VAARLPPPCPLATAARHPSCNDPTRPSDPPPDAAAPGAGAAVAGAVGPAGLPAWRARQPAWLQGLIDALVDLSSRDALTGLANRRSFELALAREVDRVARSGEPALLLMLDIDHFKRVNDTHGHAAGDQVLRAVATALLDSVRPMDLVARIGGEEFAIVLPNCPAPFGATVAERVRRRVERAPVVVAQRGSRSRSPSASAAPLRRSGCARPRLVDRARRPAALPRQGQGRNLVQLETGAVSLVSSEERQALFDTTFRPRITNDRP
jgi:diguanylate cyclase